jgi:hypothetical protein
LVSLIFILLLEEAVEQEVLPQMEVEAVMVSTALEVVDKEEILPQLQQQLVIGVAVVAMDTQSLFLGNKIG